MDVSLNNLRSADKKKNQFGSAASRKSRELSFVSLTKSIEHESDEYQYFKSNDKFANQYVEDLLVKLLEIEIIPDIFIECLQELNFKGKSKNTQFLLPSEGYVRNLRNVNYLHPSQLVNFDNDNNDNFIDDLEYNPLYPQYSKYSNELKPYHYEPYDQIQRKKMTQYNTTNVLDFLMIDNLLQNVKIDNSDYKSNINGLNDEEQENNDFSIANTRPSQQKFKNQTVQPAGIRIKRKEIPIQDKNIKTYTSNYEALKEIRAITKNKPHYALL